MAEPSSGNEEKEMTKGNSFTRFLRSPGPETSPKKKSSNPLAKLLLRRKSSRRGDDNGSEPNTPEVVDREPAEEEEEDEEKDPSFVEEVKEVVETAVHDLIHRKKKETSVDHTDDARDISPKSISSDSSSETKESKHEHHFLDKFKGGLGKAKEEYGKAKEEFKSILHQDKSQHEHFHVEVDEVKAPKLDLDKKQKHDISIEKKPLIDEVKAPNLAQRLQEEVVAVISTIDNTKTGKTSQEESKEIIKEGVKGEEKKKEDNCITSLAQGLHSFCSWGSKKED